MSLVAGTRISQFWKRCFRGEKAPPFWSQITALEAAYTARFNER